MRPAHTPQTPRPAPRAPGRLQALVSRFIPGRAAARDPLPEKPARDVHAAAPSIGDRQARQAAPGSTPRPAPEGKASLPPLEQVPPPRLQARAAAQPARQWPQDPRRQKLEVLRALQEEFSAEKMAARPRHVIEFFHARLADLVDFALKHRPGLLDGSPAHMETLLGAALEIRNSPSQTMYPCVALYKELKKRDDAAATALYESLSPEMRRTLIHNLHFRAGTPHRLPPRPRPAARPAAHLVVRPDVKPPPLPAQEPAAGHPAAGDRAGGDQRRVALPAGPGSGQHRL